MAVLFMPMIVMSVIAMLLMCIVVTMVFVSVISMLLMCIVTMVLMPVISVPFVVMRMVGIGIISFVATIAYRLLVMLSPETCILRFVPVIMHPGRPLIDHHFMRSI